MPAVHREALLQFVGNLFIHQANCDLATVLSSASLMSFEEQDRQEFMTQSDILKDFLGSDSSSAVLVQGNSLHDDNIASTSIYASSLVIAVQQLNVPVIHFTAGLHNIPYAEDTFLGPYGMMLALLQQFLEIYPLDHLSFLDRDILSHRFQDVQSIGRLMHALVSNEPRTSNTFCIIDGISFFENFSCEADTHQAIGQLLGLVSDANGCFKLLITSPTRSAFVPQHLVNFQARYDVLDVPPNMVQGRRQGVGPSTLVHSISDDVMQTRQFHPW